MTKRKYGIFTIARSVPNWFTASQHIEAPTEETNEVFNYGVEASPVTPYPHPGGSTPFGRSRCQLVQSRTVYVATSGRVG